MPSGRSSTGCATCSSYRRAIQLAARNPWYHHNLGHLLDVGLGDAKAALKHLQLAYELQPQEDEIGASLAHCFARLGRLDEAHKLAAEAIAHAPGNREHRVLIEWIEQGAPGRAPVGATQRPRITPPGASAQRSATSADPNESIAGQTSAPRSTSSFAMGSDPPLMASINAVCPSRLGEFTSAPASTES